ncbi:MAG: nuclear transport factor 2 family protein [Xanthomonadales bacterium]|nr:nuclear transport factor 2 family protein [Gammaproteobacteria bacterium]NNE04591.1 nuclear transport factor 2 family protein [Xanthomonadales bacterium]NNL95605.1 nuclear transport factor 2 family protein [Xanthomonadales bacterium]
MNKDWGVLLCSAALSACQPTAGIDVAAEAEALMAADIAFASLSETTTPKQAFAAYMAPDGMLLPRGSEGAIQGLENIMTLFGPDGDPGYQLLWQPQFAEVAQAGDMGWTWGQYQVVVEGETENTGKYVNVWKKQPDGSWKVRVDVGNQRP